MYNKRTIANNDWNKFRQCLPKVALSNTLTLNKEDTLVSISYEQYRIKDLWWIIAMYNNLAPVINLKLGSTIKIPKLQEINKLIKSLEPINQDRSL